MNRLPAWLTGPSAPPPTPAAPVVRPARPWETTPPVFVPLWAIGRSAPKESGDYREWVWVHSPPQPCATGCGKVVAYSTRAVRPKTRGGRVYCSPEHKALADQPTGQPKTPPSPEPDGPPRCPRPDKLAFTTEAECRTILHTVFAFDGTLEAYLCKCGSWHAGHPHFDAGQTIGAIARITNH